MCPLALPVTASPAEVGGVYTKKVKIRNVTSVIRTLRLFPPAS